MRNNRYMKFWLKPCLIFCVVALSVIFVSKWRANYSQPGIDVECHSDKTTYYRMQPIRLEMRITNVTNKVIDGDEWELGDEPEVIIITDENGKQLSFTERGKSHFKYLTLPPKFNGTHIGSGLLDPGSHLSTYIWLNDYVDFSNKTSMLSEKMKFNVQVKVMGHLSPVESFEVFNQVYKVEDPYIMSSIKSHLFNRKNYNKER